MNKSDRWKNNLPKSATAEPTGKSANVEPDNAIISLTSDCRWQEFTRRSRNKWLKDNPY
jgi:hypothetical protein